MSRTGWVLRCHVCREELRKPATGWLGSALRARMEAGDRNVVDDINRAFSKAIIVTNARHFVQHGITPENYGT